MGGDTSRKQIATCFIFLLLGQEVAAMRSAANMRLEAEAETGTESDASLDSALTNLASSYTYSPGDEARGEAFRGRLKYYKHTTNPFKDCGFSVLWQFGCYVSRIHVLERGINPGEVVLKIFSDYGEAKTHFDNAVPFPTDARFQNKFLKHTVRIPKHAMVAYRADGMLEIRVDNEELSNQGWDRNLVSKYLDLWADPDDRQVQLRQQADPNGVLMRKVAKSDEDLVDVWSTAFKNLQILDTCLIHDTCFTQCYYIEELGGCSPKHFCREVSPKTCESVGEDVELSVAWRSTMSDMRVKIKDLEECLLTCKDQWEMVQNEVNSWSDMYDSLIEKKDKLGSERPKLYEALDDEPVEALLNELLLVFLKHKQEKTVQGAALRGALWKKGCNLDGPHFKALTSEMVSHEDSDKVEEHLAGLLNDCPMLGEELGKTPAQRTKDANDQRETTSKQVAEYSKKGKTFDENVILQGIHGSVNTALMQLNSTALILETTGTQCEAFCWTGIAIAALIVGGLLLMLVGRLLCWAGTAIWGKIRGRDKTDEGRQLTEYQYKTCATVTNRIGYVFFIVGLICAFIWLIALCIAAMICSGGGCNLLQTSETKALPVPEDASVLSSHSNATSMAETDSGTGFCGSGAFMGNGLYGYHSYWFWWSFPTIDVNLPDYHETQDERDLRDSRFDKFRT